MKRCTVLERGRIVPGDSGETSLSRCVIPTRLYEKLKRVELRRREQGLDGLFQWRHNYALVGQWVGVMQIPGLQLEILPKICSIDQTDQVIRQNMMEMLNVAGLGSLRSRGVADLSVKRGSIHDQLVDVFLDGLLMELKRGLDRSYEPEESNLYTLRGRLLMQQQIAKNSAQQHRFYCRHDVMTEGTLLMTTLKSACHALLNRTLDHSLTSKAQLAYAILADVPDKPFEPEKLVSFTRQNFRFKDYYYFARMILMGQAPDARAGRVETYTLLFNMEQLFERYIAKFVQREIMGTPIDGMGKVELIPQAQDPLLKDSSSGKAKYVTRPDLLFVHKGLSEETFVADTKWKVVKSGRDKKGRASNADIYQLYAYLNQYKASKAFLLYPKVAQSDLQELTMTAYNTRGTNGIGEIGVRFVDLDAVGDLSKREGKEKLKKQLIGLIREGFDLQNRESAHETIPA